MTSSRTASSRTAAHSPNARAGSCYTRFIPREELRGFASWRPGAFDEAGAASTQPGDQTPVDRGDDARRESDLRAQLHTARQGGYEDGYRDGLVALESFKHSLASQLSAQIGQLVASFDREFESIEQQLADTLTRVAVELARQVVRSELATRPELVAGVAREALATLLASSRAVTVEVHPDDLPLVADGAREALEARGASVVADPAIERGGCVVRSDVGEVDARIEARWDDATRSLATGAPREQP